MLDLNPVYNYYSTVYMPSTQTKYDSHKKSELKNIYNNMVKVNTKSPLFKFKVNNHMQDYAIGLKSAAIGLKNFSEYLSDQEEDAFSKLTSVSSDPRKLTGSVITTDYKSLPDSLSFTVDSLAKNQINSGVLISSSDLDMAPGAYSFTISSGLRDYSFNFNVREHDTNLGLQQHIASLINRSSVGVDAYVDKQSSKSRLILESDDTGTENLSDDNLMFNISDDDGRPNGIVSTYQLNNVIQYPDDAAFTINNTPMTSSSNSIAINKMVEVELQDSFSEPVTLSFVPDTEDVLNKVKDFTDSYNRIIDIAEDNADSQRGAKKLLHEVKRITNRHISSLEAVGLTVGADGRISTDDALLAQSVQNGEVKGLFSNISGFKNDIEAKTMDISLDPMNYVDKTVVTYPNPGHTFANPYVPSIYSGMLYNYYI